MLSVRDSENSEPTLIPNNIIWELKQCFNQIMNILYIYYIIHYIYIYIYKITALTTYLYHFFEDIGLCRYKIFIS